MARETAAFSRAPPGSGILECMGVLSPEELGLDLSRWPVVVAVMPPEAFTPQRLDAWLDAFEHHVLARRQPYATVLDMSDSPRTTPEERKRMADRLRGGDDHQRMCVAGAFVMQSTLARGALTAVMWLRKPEYPTRVFASRQEAIAWAYTFVDPQRRAAPGPADSASQGHDTSDALRSRLDKLERLRQRGVISEDEFHAQRRALLEQG